MIMSLLRIPLDQQFSVQQVFALRDWDSFIVWNFLIFEVVKLCRMKKYPPDSTSLSTFSCKCKILIGKFDLFCYSNPIFSDQKLFIAYVG
jgi:hypothetical protein